MPETECPGRDEFFFRTSERITIEEFERRSGFRLCLGPDGFHPEGDLYYEERIVGEIKAENPRHINTGNIAYEYQNDDKDHPGHKKPSGPYATRAAWVLHRFGNPGVIYIASSMRSMVDKYGMVPGVNRYVMGHAYGDHGAECLLLNISMLVNDGLAYFLPFASLACHCNIVLASIGDASF